MPMNVNLALKQMDDTATLIVDVVGTMPRTESTGGGIRRPK